jgi:hypothetical protein
MQTMQKFLAFLRTLFTRRNAMRLIFAVVLAITLWIAFCIEERWRGNRAWQSYRVAAQARGVPLTVEAIRPPAIPDAENYAAIPMIQALFEARQEGAIPPKWFEALKLDSGNAKRPVYHGAVPPSVVEYRDHFVREGVIASAGPDPAADVLAALAKVEPELAQLEEAGKRPRSSFPVPWELGFAASVPHLGPLRQAVDVYQIRLAAHLAQGESAAAYQDFEDVIRIYRALEHAPGLICGLVRVSILQRLAGRVHDGMTAGQWKAAELEKIQADFARLNITDDWRFAMNSERAVMNDTCDDLYKRSDRSLSNFMNVVGGSKGQSPALNLPAVSFYPRGWLRLSQAKINEYFDRSIARVDAIAAGGTITFPNDVTAEVERLARSGPIARLRYLLYVMLAPALSNVENSYLHCLSTVAQTQIACALERYRLAKGSFPENIEEISPEFIGKIPLDPIAQAPMRYRRSAPNHFELWSVAMNGTDDSAAEDQEKSPRDQPDWVWRR